MRTSDLLTACVMIGLASPPALADLAVPIPGGVPRLGTRFTPFAPARAADPQPVVPARAPSVERASQIPPAAPPGALPAAVPADEFEPPPPGPRWTMPMMERRLGQTERTANLSPLLLEAILRIEGLYDPTRVDATGTRARQHISAGTASMNNVFADRWHVGDTDANVSYRVRYIAQAWQMPPDQPCTAYDRHRPGYDIVELTNVSLADCVRIKRLRGPQPDLIAHVVVAAAAMSLPVFAAPEPGGRLSSAEFWAAQKTKVEAIRALAEFRRMRQTTRLIKRAGPYQPDSSQPARNRPL